MEKDLLAFFFKWESQYLAGWFHYTTVRSSSSTLGAYIDAIATCQTNSRQFLIVLKELIVYELASKKTSHGKKYGPLSRRRSTA